MPLLRLGFAGYLAEALCDVTLTLLFYVLLRPVQRDLSLLAAFFGLIGTSVFAASELCFYAASLVVGHGGALAAFTPGQVQALAGLFLRIYGLGSSAFLAFGGAGALVLGFLVVRSGYLPKALGLLVALGGLGFILRTFTLLLAPGLVIDKVYCGYWFWGRPSPYQLWQDLQELSMRIKPDFDPTTAAAKAEWKRQTANGKVPAHH